MTREELHSVLRAAAALRRLSAFARDVLVLEQLIAELGGLEALARQRGVIAEKPECPSAP
jgi:hypothetical protein